MSSSQPNTEPPTPNMATRQRGQKWTNEKASDAAAKHYYIKVAEKGGKLQLSGASKKFAENPDFIYVPTPYRVAGDRADVAALFSGLGVPDDDVERILTVAYTADNYQGNAAFAQELDDAKAYKDAQGKPAAAAPRLTLEDLATILETHRGQAPAKGARKPRATKTAAAPGTTPTRGGRVRPLLDRLAELKTGKVLDVSNMSETGAGVKAVDEPKAGSKKVGVPGLAIVSSNPDNYYAAVATLGPDYAHFSEAYRQRLAVPVADAAVPVARVKTPTKATTTAKVPTPKATTTAKVPTPKAAVTTVPKLAAMPTMAVPKRAGK